MNETDKQRIEEIRKICKKKDNIGPITTEFLLQKLDEQTAEIERLNKEIEISHQYVREHGMNYRGEIFALKKQADSMFKTFQDFTSLNLFLDPPQDIAKYNQGALDFVIRKSKQIVENYRSGK